MDPIGFKQESRQIEEKSEEEIKVLEGDYHKLLDEIDGERIILNRELKLIKEIEDELVRIYKRIKVLEKLYNRRGKLVHLTNGITKTNPEKAASLVDGIFGMDRHITEEYNKIAKELQKHNLQDLHEIYNKEKLSAEKLDHIKKIVSTMGNELNYLGQNIANYHAQEHNYITWKNQIMQNKIN